MKVNKDELLDYFTIENKNGIKTIESELKKTNNLLYSEIIKWNYNSDIPFKEKIYRYIYKITENIKCNCCNNNTKFTNSLHKGYRKYCSRKCSGSSLERMVNVKITCTKKYGVESVLSSELVKNKIKKTNLSKYGYENPFSNKIIKAKIKETNLKKYGIEYAILNEDIKNKSKKTILNKYGVTHYSKTNEFRKKSTEKNINKLKKRFLDIGYEILEYGQEFLTVKHPDGHIFSDIRTRIINRLDCNNELSTVLLPLYASSTEIELFEFVSNLNNSDCLKNKRKILNGLELDIYLPDYKLGVEFNGLYWHSNLYKNKNYHLNKTELCEKQGIELLHIFEDEWINKNEIVKSIIKSKLNLIDNKIFAKNCEIKEINGKTSEEFLVNNHIQDNINSEIQIGLFNNDKLVSLMAFSEKQNYKYEILRFSDELNIQVVDGASKLLNYFIETYKPNSILTYVDRRYSQGEIYKQLGFEFIENTEPNYYYFTSNELKRYHIYNFSKDILVKDGFDSNKTEFQIMNERGYMRIYDCGQIKFELKLQ